MDRSWFAIRSVLIAHPEGVKHVQSLPRILAVCAAISLGGAGYSIWSTQTRLVFTIAAVRALKRETAEMSRSLHDRREQIQQAADLQTADPLGRGSMELTAEFSRLARAAQVQIGTFHIAPVGLAADSQGANATPVNAPGGKGAEPAAADRKGRWAQATFDYEFTGAFPALSDLLRHLAESPRIIEITSLEMARAQAAGPSGKVTVHLRLSGFVYGLPEAG